jgi:hypothetical protein
MVRMEADNFMKIELWKLLSEMKRYVFREFIFSFGKNDSQEKVQVRVYLYDNYVRLTYIHVINTTGEEKNFDYNVILTKTPCHFGGFRHWFQCPLCNKRVGVLYKVSYIFGCRHCFGLTYSSRKFSGMSKLISKVISNQELEVMESKIKRKTYRGNLTKKNFRFLKKKYNNHALCVNIINTLNKNLDRNN